MKAKDKPIMKESPVISREGRFLLAVIITLLLILIAGTAFILKGQEVQGEMLNQTMKASEQLQATVENVQEEVAEMKSLTLLGTLYTTFYCAGFGDGCAVCGTNGVTATETICSPLGNKWVTIAVDPRVIPYGTELKIVMGDTIIYGVAEDTGGFASGLYPVKQIDICTANHEEAVQLGEKELKVYVIGGE